MADIWTKQKRSEVMGLVRGKGNKSTEVALVRLFRLHKITGWRRHLAMPGKPDFCFPIRRVAIFVDGCFWHGCPKCYRRPKTNKRFWDTKRENNMARDKRVNRELKEQGYMVIRIFEHELKTPAKFLKCICKATGNSYKSVL